MWRPAVSDDRKQRTIGGEVFAKLRATWGTRFLALWRGSDMVEVLSTWDEALAGIDPERIQRALVDCQNAENPPTLPDFLRLCRAQRAANDHQPRCRTAVPRRVPSKPARTSSARAACSAPSARPGAATRWPGLAIHARRNRSTRSRMAL